MDNYLLMGHILKCKVVPTEEVHPNLWVGANRKWRVVPHDRVARVQHNKVCPSPHFVLYILTHGTIW
jgi:nucleolar protein 15